MKSFGKVEEFARKLGGTVLATSEDSGGVYRVELETEGRRALLAAGIQQRPNGAPLLVTLTASAPDESFPAKESLLRSSADSFAILQPR